MGDDKCTKVATGDKKRTATFTDKDQTNVEVKDGKTVTKIDADISVTSTCNGGSSAPVVANATLTSLNSGHDNNIQSCYYCCCFYCNCCTSLSHFTKFSKNFHKTCFQSVVELTCTQQTCTNTCEQKINQKKL